MAVAPVGSAVSAKDVTGIATLTLPNVAIATGNLLVVFSTVRTAGAPTMSDITFNAVSFVATTVFSVIDNALGQRTYGHYMTGMSGTHDVVLTWSVAPGGMIAATAFVFSGADTATPFGTAQTSTGGGASTATSTANITIAAGGLGIDVLSLRDSVAATAGGTATHTQQSSQTDAGSEGHWTGTSSASGSASLSWTWSASGFDHIAIPIAAAAAAGDTQEWRGCYPSQKRFDGGNLLY